MLDKVQIKFSAPISQRFKIEQSAKENYQALGLLALIYVLFVEKIITAKSKG